MRHVRSISTAVALMLVATVGLTSLYAQNRVRRQPTKPPQMQEKEVTLTGKLVDLQCYMTGKYPTKDEAECARNCLRAGVPAALETDKGLVIVGMGYRGPGHALAQHAMATVELKGKLYEKQGVKYMDVASVKVTKPAPKAEAEEEQPEEPEQPEQPQEPEQPEPNEP
jgi:hypothetical protein